MQFLNNIRQKWAILRGGVPKIEPKQPQKVSITDLFSCPPMPRLCFDMPKFTRAYA